MLSLPPSVRIFVSRQPVDMRKGFDSLAQLVRSHLAGDPLSGHLFVFRSKRGDRLKVLYWDSDGLCLWYKRLEIGVFTLPTAGSNVGEHGLEIRAGDLALLLEGIDLAGAKRQKRYQRPAAAPAAVTGH
jgi:transposase